MNNRSNALCDGKIIKIHTILVPTVPSTDNIIGTVEYPIPRSAPGNRSMIPHRKYVIVVHENIAMPFFIKGLFLMKKYMELIKKEA